MKKHFSNIKKWIVSHRMQSLAIGGVLLITIATGIAAWAWQATKPGPIDDTPIAIQKREPKYYSPLTGMKVKNEAATKQAVTAIMIENSPDARPHSGLKQAGVVYEAIAEAGITRYLALYQESKPDLVGPVRSLRLYYVDWLTPYQASVAHVGGSSQALKLVRNGKYRDIDQFFYPQTYWRASDRYAPHNVYTSFKNIDALNKQKKYTKSEFKSFSRTDGKAAAEPTASRVKIDFSGPTYNTEYRYNKERNNYTRYLAGEPHKDREKGTITPSVVIAMWVNETTVMQDGAREAIKTSGSGKATIFQNGKAKNVTWRKKSRTQPLELLDKEGKPVKLIRGQTWIAAVPNGKGNVSW